MKLRTTERERKHLVSWHSQLPNKTKDALTDLDTALAEVERLEGEVKDTDKAWSNWAKDKVEALERRYQRAVGPGETGDSHLRGRWRTTHTNEPLGCLRGVLCRQGGAGS